MKASFAAHAEVSRAILNAGKHVYSEKPLATKRGDAKKILKTAKKKKLRVGGAPDTFLGGAWQTIRKLIDDGAIRANEPHRCSGEMTYHVVDVMRALLKSAKDGRQIKLKSEGERPAALT